jgi:hypothetical protein
LLQSIREVSGIIFVVTFIVKFQRLTFSQLSVSFSPPPPPLPGAAPLQSRKRERNAESFRTRRVVSEPPTASSR